MDTESFNLFRLVSGRVARTSTLSTTATRAINLSDTLISSAKFCPDFHPLQWPLGEETDKELLATLGVKMFGSFESCHWRSSIVHVSVITSLINVFSNREILLTLILFFTYLRNTVYYRQFSDLIHFTEIIICGKSHVIDDGPICFSQRNRIAF